MKGRKIQKSRISWARYAWLQLWVANIINNVYLSSLDVSFVWRLAHGLDGIIVFHR
jgi:hypothetical protein